MIMLNIMHNSCITAIICGLLKRLYCLPYVKIFSICQFSLIIFVAYSYLFLSYSTGTSPIFSNLFISRKALQAIGMAMVKLHTSAQA